MWAKVGWAEVGVQLNHDGTVDATGTINSKSSSCIIQRVDPFRINMNEEGDTVCNTTDACPVDDGVSDVVLVISLEGVVDRVVEGNGGEGRARKFGILARQFQATVGAPCGIAVEGEVHVAEIHTSRSLRRCGWRNVDLGRYHSEDGAGGQQVRHGTIEDNHEGRVDMNIIGGARELLIYRLLDRFEV